MIPGKCLYKYKISSSYQVILFSVTAKILNVVNTKLNITLSESYKFRV